MALPPPAGAFRRGAPAPVHDRAAGALGLEGGGFLVVQERLLEAQQPNGDEGDSHEALRPGAHHGHQSLVVPEPQPVLEEKRLEQEKRGVGVEC